ncbi:hypothetical protein [Streptosporangium sp. NPDC001681]|uniref:hypothetical protein n=1 Tax=Streptosporangium sp. NPDC001681 TaxID=3154395 RepID=UPI0033344D47
MTTDNLPAIRNAELAQRIEYSQQLAFSTLLPPQYVKQPANVLWAMEFGRSVGVDPMTAITEVHIIKGKPTSSAGLVSGLVRKAGHRMRTWVERDENGALLKAVSTVHRSDDPEFEFRSEWTIVRAQTAGLLKQNENYGKYPEAMLVARSQTEAARMACKEALCGLGYTPEELGAVVNEDGSVVITEAREVKLGQTIREAAETISDANVTVMASTTQLRRLAELMTDKGVTDKLGYLHQVLPDYTFKSSADLTAAQVSQVENALNRGDHLPTSEEPGEPEQPEPPAAETVTASPAAAPAKEEPPSRKAQHTEMGVWFGEAGITHHTGTGMKAKNDAARFAWITEHLGVEVTSTKELNAAHADEAIRLLTQQAAARREDLRMRIVQVWSDLGGTNEQLTAEFQKQMEVSHTQATNQQLAAFLTKVNDGKVTPGGEA